MFSGGRRKMRHHYVFRFSQKILKPRNSESKSFKNIITVIIHKSHDGVLYFVSRTLSLKTLVINVHSKQYGYTFSVNQYLRNSLSEEKKKRINNRTVFIAQLQRKPMRIYNF